MPDLSAIRSLAARQHGLVTRDQCREAGIHRQQVARLVNRGQFAHLTPRVLRIGGSAVSPWQSVMAGVLDTGHDARASHLSAAALWGVPGIRPEPVHVAMTRVLRRRDPAAVRIHHLTLIPDDQRTHLHDIPVTGPALTALLVFGLHGLHTGARVLDHLLASRMLTVSEAWSTVDRMSRRGRNGLVAMRQILELRSDLAVPPQSNNERRFEDIIRSAGVAAFDRQVDIAAPIWVGRVDYRDRSLPLIVEIHSERYHTSSAHRAEDAVRIRRLETAGFMVLVVWDHEIWSDPDAVVGRVVAARRLLAHGDLYRRVGQAG